MYVSADIFNLMHLVWEVCTIIWMNFYVRYLLNVSVQIYFGCEEYCPLGCDAI
jgi:hypothetical protein